jgi:hypothetical protein
MAAAIVGMDANQRFLIRSARSVVLTRFSLPNNIAFQIAEVAELADALGSGSSGLKLVGVRVPPSAPNEIVLP